MMEFIRSYECIRRCEGKLTCKDECKCEFVCGGVEGSWQVLAPHRD